MLKALDLDIETFVHENSGRRRNDTLTKWSLCSVQGEAKDQANAWIAKWDDAMKTLLESLVKVGGAAHAGPLNVLLTRGAFLFKRCYMDYIANFNEPSLVQQGASVAHLLSYLGLTPFMKLLGSADPTWTLRLISAIWCFFNPESRSVWYIGRALGGAGVLLGSARQNFITRNPEDYHVQLTNFLNWLDRGETGSTRTFPKMVRDDFQHTAAYAYAKGS